VLSRFAATMKIRPVSDKWPASPQGGLYVIYCLIFMVARIAFTTICYLNSIQPCETISYTGRRYSQPWL